MDDTEMQDAAPQSAVKSRAKSQAREQENLKAKLTRYFFQLSEGCGYEYCQNGYCASNKDVAPLLGNAAAALAIKLAKSRIDEYQCPATLHLNKLQRGLTPITTPAPPSTPTQPPGTGPETRCPEKPISDLIREVFSNADSLNRSFLQTPHIDESSPRIISRSSSPTFEDTAANASNATMMSDDVNGARAQTGTSGGLILSEDGSNRGSGAGNAGGVDAHSSAIGYTDTVASANANANGVSFSSSNDGHRLNSSKSRGGGASKRGQRDAKKNAGNKGADKESPRRTWDHNKFLNLKIDLGKYTQDQQHIRPHDIRVNFAEVRDVFTTIFAFDALRHMILVSMNMWAAKVKSTQRLQPKKTFAAFPTAVQGDGQRQIFRHEDAGLPPTLRPLPPVRVLESQLPMQSSISTEMGSITGTAVALESAPTVAHTNHYDIPDSGHEKSGISVGMNPHARKSIPNGANHATSSMLPGANLGQYVIIFENPALMEHEYQEMVMPQLMYSLAMLSEADQDRLALYWSRNGHATMLQRVQKVQQYITMRILTKTSTNDSYSPNKDIYVAWAVKALAILFRANMLSTLVHGLGDTAKPVVDLTEFYNDAINDHINLRTDFPIWKAGDGGFSFCHFPFVLTSGTKSEILKVECIVQMRHEMQDAYFRSIFHGPNDPYLFLTIRRSHLIRDALLQLQSKNPKDLKKQLRVTFVGEEGVDEGGVQKEFFQLVIRDIFDPKYGMFTYNEAAHHYWINPTSAYLGSEGEFFLVGLVLGLAIYNSIILDVRFPMVVYKKLTIPSGADSDINVDVTLDDLKEADPELARGLEQLLKFEGDVSSTYHRTFQVEYDLFGEVQTVDLTPNGGVKQLTIENREEYVDLYVQWVLNHSIATQFKELKRGFDVIAVGGALQLFRHEELELLICGCQDLDFEALEASTEYDGGFTAQTPVIKYFWEIVHEFTDAQKKRLLFFATGSDRVPIGGLANLHFVIAKNGADSERLPTAHTCFNVLLLCDYSSKESLKAKILTAIENAEGFGML